MKAIICILYLIVLPLILGRIFVSPKGEARRINFIKSFVFGFVLLLASSFVPAIIAVFKDWSLTFFMKVWSAILIALLIWALILYIKDIIRHTSRDRQKKARASKAGVGTILLEIGCIALLCLHVCTVTYTMHVDDDDVVYVGAATTSVDTDTVFRYNPQSGLPIKDMNENSLDRIAAAPLHVFVAAVSKLSGVRPAVLSHTILPPVLTVAFFMVIYLLGWLLFERDRTKTALFTLFAWLAIIYSGFSVYTSGVFLMTRSWQGKGIFCGLLIPAALYIFIRLYQEKGSLHGNDALCLLSVSMAASLATSMGAALLCMMAAVWLLMLLIRFRHFGRTVLTALCFAPAAFGVVLYLAIHHQIIR